MSRIKSRSAVPVATQTALARVSRGAPGAGGEPSLKDGVSVGPWSDGVEGGGPVGMINLSRISVPPIRTCRRNTTAVLITSGAVPARKPANDHNARSAPPTLPGRRRTQSGSGRGASWPPPCGLLTASTGAAQPPPCPARPAAGWSTRLRPCRTPPVARTAPARLGTFARQRRTFASGLKVGGSNTLA